jgi:hypothetical protein
MGTSLQPKILRAHRPRTSDAVQPPDGDAQDEAYTQDLPKRHGLLTRHGKHLIAGMVLMLGFYLLLSRLIIPFVVNTQQHWEYGYSRVSVYDFNVGHHGISHFVAQYYKKQIVVVEIPVDNPNQSHIYAASETVEGDTGEHVITLSTAYVSRHPIAGKPDLIVSVSGFAIPVVLYNTGESFQVGE